MADLWAFCWNPVYPTPSGNRQILHAAVSRDLAWRRRGEPLRARLRVPPGGAGGEELGGFIGVHPYLNTDDVRVGHVLHQ